MKQNREQARKFFERDVANHQMQVLRDDGGSYRHLLFRRPGTSCYHFNIVTYPGTLVYTGDMGSFVFQRVQDMFDFFREDVEHGDGINPGYWAEKLVAIDRYGLTEFEEETFTRKVISHLVYWVRVNRERTSKDTRRLLWESVINEVLNADSGAQGLYKKLALHEFSHDVRFLNGRRARFEFTDCLEWNLEDYNMRFYWACHAIAWAVKQYDKAKASKAGVAA